MVFSRMRVKTLHKLSSQQTLSPPTRSSGGIRADIDLSSSLLVPFFPFLPRGGTSPRVPSCPLRSDRRAGGAGGKKNVFHLHVLIRPRVMIDDREFVCRGEREGKRAKRTSSPESGIRTDCSARRSRFRSYLLLLALALVPAALVRSPRGVRSRECDLRDLREGEASRRGSSFA